VKLASPAQRPKERERLTRTRINLDRGDDAPFRVWGNRGASPKDLDQRAIVWRAP
jgi:hypothetical protein